MVCGMNLRTPSSPAVAVLSALGGVAAAAIALPSRRAWPTAAAVAPTATPTPEVRTKTIRRTIHVVRRDKVRGRLGLVGAHPGRRAPARRAPVGHRLTLVLRPTTPATTARGDDDSGHHSGGGDDGHHGGDDDSGHGRGRGRGRGGDDD